MTLLLSNITEKHNHPRHGYKRNKYRLRHHGTIVNKRCRFDSYRNILFSSNCFNCFTIHLQNTCTSTLLVHYVILKSSRRFYYSSTSTFNIGKFITLITRRRIRHIDFTILAIATIIKIKVIKRRQNNMRFRRSP